VVVTGFGSGYIMRSDTRIHERPRFPAPSARPIEFDTTIFVQQFERIGKIPFLLELWVWDNIIGQSAIFLSDDVEQWTDKRLIAFVTEAVHTDIALVTVKRLPDYTFINYGFET
jgi:hypothetical protein